MLVLGALSACQFSATPLAAPTHSAAAIPESSLTLLEPSGIAPPPAPPPLATLSPANSMGWGRAELTEVFGTADYIRRDGVGEVHQYRLEHCIIDFTLYPVASRFEVIAWHGRSRQQAQDIDSDACTRDLEKRQIHR